MADRAVGGILILVFATRERTLPLLARWLDVGGPPQKADAVVLLNGGLNTRPFRGSGPRAWRLGAEAPREHRDSPVPIKSAEWSRRILTST